MSYYSDNADTLFKRYNQADPEQLHADWLKYLPEQPGLACDIGAGTGRDANWLARKGWDVIAIEPEAGFRETAKKQSHPNVSWLKDELPNLTQLCNQNQRFELILISAVWMHVPPSERRCAFGILNDLLVRDGTLVISLRHSKSEQEIAERGFYPVSVMELEQLSKEKSALIESISGREDGQGRDYVSWETVVIRSAESEAQ